jgi:protoporphyrinogen oxidase
MKNPILILGGGPAGLAAGFHATQKGLDFRVFEAGKRIGGMCATLSFGDFHFDLGAHRFHDKDGVVTQEIMELMGNTLHKIDIPSQIYLDGQLIDFPLTPSNLLRNIGLFTAIKSGIQCLISRVSQRVDAFHDFEQFALYKYGRSIAERFLLNYSEKLWGLPCSRLSPAVSGKRLKGLSLTAFIMETFATTKAKSGHLDGAFYYPQRGFGEIMEGLARAIGKKRYLTNKRVTRIFHRDHMPKAVELNHKEIVKTNRIISTLPLPHFLELLEPRCPEEISVLAKGLTYRRLVLVMLFLNRNSVTRSGTVYFPGSEFPFNRISEPRNRSPWMTPPGKTSLIAEIACGQDEPLSEGDRKRWVQTVCEKLVQIGWIKESDILDSRVEFVDYAYPVLDLDHGEKLARIMDYLGSFQGLKLIGRNSLFKYTHFHDMMRSGREAIDSLTRR